MKFKITWSIWLSSAKSRGHCVHLHDNLAIVGIVEKFPDQILAQIWNVRHSADKGVQNESMTVGILLSDGNGGFVIQRVVDASGSFDASLHFESSFGVIDVLDGPSKRPSFRIQRNHNKSGIPVVYSQHILLSTVDCEVAGGSATSVDGLAQLLQRSVRTELVRKNFTVILAILSASVDNVQTRVVARKGRVHDSCGIALDVEQHQRSIRRIETVHKQRVLRLSSSGAVS